MTNPFLYLQKVYFDMLSFLQIFVLPEVYIHIVTNAAPIALWS